MLNQLEEADFVLAICTETYHRRVRGREELGKGLGATWEGFIITQAIYEAASRNNKYIPIIFSADDAVHIPIFLRGVTRYDLSFEVDYQKLYHRLIGQPAASKSPLGELRGSLILEDDGQAVAPAQIAELKQVVRDCGGLLRLHKNTIANTGIHLERDVVQQIVTWSQSKEEDSLAFLLDDAGMGKTVAMRDVLDALENAGVTVLAIKADQQLSGITSADEIQGRLRLPDTVERLVGLLAGLGPIVVLIDQLDALSLSMAHDQRALDVVLDLIARLRTIPNVRLLLSCRVFDKKNDPRLNRIQTVRQFSLSPLPEEAVKNVLSQIGVNFSQLSETTQKLLRSPLHLDLFVLALDGQPVLRHDLTNLQDLYRMLWTNVVVKYLPDGPSAADRVEVISLLTDYMNSNQVTSAPQLILEQAGGGHLEPAVNYMASAGILLRGPAEWTFLHQTFFDYCFAYRFVSRGGTLSEMILNGEQGLFERAQLIQILAYLRGTAPETYLRELHTLLFSGGLRPHLRELLYRWFGALPEPSVGEWNVARRMLLDNDLRLTFFRVAWRNPGWFAHLKGRALQRYLEGDDQTLDTLVLPYLSSIINEMQAEVVNAISPYAGRGEQWNRRLIQMLSAIRSWHTLEAASLYEQLFPTLLASDSSSIRQLDDVAKAYPQSGCRLIRVLFDRTLDNYLAGKQNETIGWDSIKRELESIHRSTIQASLNVVAQAEPKLFLETMLPWLERVMTLRQERDDDYHFTSDELSNAWDASVYVVNYQLIQALIGALSSLARDKPDEFRPISERLAQLPYETPQQLIVRAYIAAPEVYAGEALNFLLADRRRLELGNEQYETRQMIKAISPHLSVEQWAELESVILAYDPQWLIDLYGLHGRGLVQLRLLKAAPLERLTPHGRRRLEQMDRKIKSQWPDYQILEKPVTHEMVLIGSPIDPDAAAKMSDDNWLGAMKKYRGNVSHKEFARGGARELGGVLVSLVKIEPERFHRLFMQRVPDDVDDSYVQACLNGLAESDAPAELLFDLVRRFAPHEWRDIQGTIARTLRKRIKDGLPDDLLDLMESFVRAPIKKDEERWIEEQAREGARGGLNHGPYSGYMNSDRGAMMETLIEALNSRGTGEAEQRKWELLEWVASDPSTALRAGAVEDLLDTLNDAGERSVSLFERLMEGHPALIRSFYTQEFLYYGIYRFFPRLKPFIVALMNDEVEECQQRGAELACIATISRRVDSDPEGDADMADSLISGPAIWRRGAARIYAHNADGKSSDVCFQMLTKLLGDEDIEVRRFVGGVFAFLSDEHIRSHRAFIEAFASSESLQEGFEELMDYLSERALLDPSWTLSVVDLVLNNEHLSGRDPWFIGGEPLVRLVLRIYNYSDRDKVMRAEAMNLFDRVMGRYPNESTIVLGEWDRR